MILAFLAGVIVGVLWCHSRRDERGSMPCVLARAVACTGCGESFAKRSGFLDARETSPQKGLPL